MKTFAEFGIILPPGSAGEVRCVCPSCTPGRKPANQRERDLCVNTEKGTWLCMHCGWSGGLGLSGAESRAPVYSKPDYPEEWTALPEKVRLFFRNRGISPETCAACKIGYQPSNDPNKSGTITFPRMVAGEVVAIKFRTHDKKFWQSKDPLPCFWNFDGAMSAPGDTLVIVEGEMDGLAVIESGHQAVVSVPNGAPAESAKNVEKHMDFLNHGKELLEKFGRIVLFVDNDAPGQKLEALLADRIGKDKCLRVASRPEGCKDANDVLKAHGKQAVLDLISRATPYPIDGLFGISDMSDAIDQLYESGLSRGLITGWKSLDEFYTVIPGYWTLVTGIPSHGKSSFLDALCVNMWELHGWKFAFCSPESFPIERHAAQLLEKFFRRPFMTDWPNARRMTPQERDNAKKLMDGNFFFCMLQDMSITGILDTMQAAISRHGVNGIVLDPWNELEYHRPANRNESEFISEALGKIRRFARMNKIHLWLVAHPTKMKTDEEGKYFVPRPYDVSGSAHFANKADNALCVYRDEADTSETKIYIQKIRPREVGRKGNVTLAFNKATQTFSDITQAETKHWGMRQHDEEEKF